MTLPKIEIKAPFSTEGRKVLIDGKEIPGVVNVAFNLDALNNPCVILTMEGDVHIEGVAEVSQLKSKRTLDVVNAVTGEKVGEVTI